MRTVRICRAPSCCTKLSRFNNGDHCFAHTPDLVEAELWRRLRLSPEFFIEGRPSIELTDGEALAYAAWEDA